MQLWVQLSWNSPRGQSLYKSIRELWRIFLAPAAFFLSQLTKALPNDDTVKVNINSEIWVWGAISPLWPRCHPNGSKPLLWKRIVYQTIVGGKNEKKTNISPFPATHTYIKLTFVSFFSIFFCTFPLEWPCASELYILRHIKTPRACSRRVSHTVQWISVVQWIFSQRKIESTFVGKKTVFQIYLSSSRCLFDDGLVSN